MLNIIKYVGMTQRVTYTNMIRGPVEQGIFIPIVAARKRQSYRRRDLLASPAGANDDRLV